MGGWEGRERDRRLFNQFSDIKAIESEIGKSMTNLERLIVLNPLTWKYKILYEKLRVYGKVAGY